MRFQVPQNLDIPDTILFGLSFVQAVYIGGALGLFIFLFFFVGFGTALLVGAPVGVLGGLLAFYKHNSQSFIDLLRAMLTYLLNDKLYVWNKQQESVAVTRKRVAQKNEEVSETQKDHNESDRIKELLTEIQFSQDSRQTS